MQDVSASVGKTDCAVTVVEFLNALDVLDGLDMSSTFLLFFANFYRTFFGANPIEWSQKVIPMWVEFNPSPIRARVGDCVVRAVSKALNQDWVKTYLDLAVEGLVLADMPSANHVWGTYLRRKGFERHGIEECPDCYTVEDFCADHPRGTYVLALNGHAVAAKDGDFYDTWNCGGEIPLYFWEKVK